MRHLPGLIFLDSSDADSAYGKGAISIVTALPEKVMEGILAEDLPALRSELEDPSATTQAADWGIPLGGLFGWVNFNGSYRFGKYHQLLVYRHDTDDWLDFGDLASHLEQPAPHGPPLVPEVSLAGGIDRAAFCAMVEKARQYIAAGDVYQVNLSQRFSAPWPDSGDALPLYGRLRECSPAPYAGFLDLGDRQVLSSSPECFLHLSGRRIRTRPIKGTRPRFRDPGEDERSAAELVTSPKEIAELVMITDLERNDLGQVCEFGSVRVTELLKLERFAQVFHLVSTVEGQLREDVDHLEALAACFPGGSISGAPKKRALEIIAELEPEQRGLYTGAIGYLGSNGESQFSIAIRSAVVENGVISYHAGAGIVTDSIPDAEYEETLQKAAGMFMSTGAGPLE